MQRRRQFIQDYAEAPGYPAAVKALCLRMYVNGMGFRGIERVTKVHYTTVITWFRQVGQNLPDAYDPDTVPEVGELDELATNARLEKNKRSPLDSRRPLQSWHLKLGRGRP